MKLIAVCKKTSQAGVRGLVIEAMTWITRDKKAQTQAHFSDVNH